MEKSNRQACFQMALNGRKSCADYFLKIKTDDNRARFLRNQQNSEKFDSETRNDSLHIKGRLTLCKDYNLFLLSQPDSLNVMTGN